MAVNADWRTFTVVGSFGLFVVLAVATCVSRLLRRRRATHWLWSLAWLMLVFVLAFFLQNFGALGASHLLSHWKLLPWMARWIDESPTALIFAAISGILALAAFWERFHRQRPESGMRDGLSG